MESEKDVCHIELANLHVEHIRGSLLLQMALQSAKGFQRLPVLFLVIIGITIVVKKHDLHGRSEVVKTLIYNFVTPECRGEVAKSSINPTESHTVGECLRIVSTQ